MPAHAASPSGAVFCWGAAERFDIMRRARSDGRARASLAEHRPVAPSREWVEGWRSPISRRNEVVLELGMVDIAKLVRAPAGARAEAPHGRRSRRSHDRRQLADLRSASSSPGRSSCADDPRSRPGDPEQALRGPGAEADDAPPRVPFFRPGSLSVMAGCGLGHPYLLPRGRISAAAAEVECPAQGRARR